MAGGAQGAQGPQARGPLGSQWGGGQGFNPGMQNTMPVAGGGQWGVGSGQGSPPSMQNQMPVALPQQQYQQAMQQLAQFSGQGAPFMTPPHTMPVSAMSQGFPPSMQNQMPMPPPQTMPVSAMSQGFPPSMQNQTPMAPPQQPQVSDVMPMAQDARFQQNPGMSPRVSNMMPSMQQQRRRFGVQGNPNAIPVRRPSWLRG